MRGWLRDSIGRLRRMVMGMYDVLVLVNMLCGVDRTQKIMLVNKWPIHVKSVKIPQDERETEVDIRSKIDK